MFASRFLLFLFLLIILILATLMVHYILRKFSRNMYYQRW